MLIPLPQKLRRPFVELYKDGEGIPQKIGEGFHVAQQDIADQWTYLQKCLGVLLPKPHGTGFRPKVLAILLCFFTVFTSNYVFSNTIAAGVYHTVLLNENGQVYTFGLGREGQLGHGDQEPKTIPTLITDLQDRITTIAAGSFHTILLTENGQVYTFGSGEYGQLGHGDREDKTTPTLITGLQGRITAIAAGSFHTVLLTENGLLYTFGSGKYGQLGHGDREDKTTPTLITGLQDNITAIAAGFYHTILLNENGQVYTFGYGLCGRLGHGDQKDKTTPTLITGLQDRITAIAAGGYHTVLLTEDGQVYTFGRGLEGQLGHGNQEWQSTPTLITGLQDKITAIAAGRLHTVLLTENGQVYTFGGGLEGQLGHEDQAEKTTPTLITGLQDRVTAITAGGYHTVLLTENSQVYTFGRGLKGQLGHGDFDGRTRPTEVLNIQPIMQPPPKKRIKSAASVADFCLLGF